MIVFLQKMHDNSYGKLKISKPVYVLRLWYNGFCGKSDSVFIYVIFQAKFGRHIFQDVKYHGTIRPRPTIFLIWFCPKDHHFSHGDDNFKIATFIPVHFQVHYEHWRFFVLLTGDPHSPGTQSRHAGFFCQVAGADKIVFIVWNQHTLNFTGNKNFQIADSFL